ncbi:MAG: hypothetical protein OXU98_00980 [Gammaproteobacteria bacterium]|nr:hypothetical protein [Gammaproteobacteria bacterium]
MGAQGEANRGCAGWKTRTIPATGAQCKSDGDGGDGDGGGDGDDGDGGDGDGGGDGDDGAGGDNGDEIPRRRWPAAARAESRIIAPGK